MSMLNSFKPSGAWGIDLMTKRKLKYNLFLYMLMFSAMILACLWFFQTVFLRDMYKAFRTQEIEKAIQEVEQKIQKNDFDFEDIKEDLEEYKDIFIRTHGEAYHFKREFHFDSNDKYRKNRPEEIEIYRQFTTPDGKTLDLYFYAIITPVEATSSTLQKQLYLVTGISIVLSILVAFLLSKKISIPIEELNESAKALGKTEVQAKFEAKGYLEIEELSQTLNQASKDLSKVEDLRRELMANISHDLRTPLALIYSYAEMMSDFPEEVSKESLKVIMDESKRLTSLVNDVMDISNLEAGQMRLVKEQYCLTEDIRDMVSRVHSMVKGKTYDIRFEYDELLDVWADRSKVGQALYNLLINAINHSHVNKNIIVKQSRLNERVLIEVIDHGQGIKEEDLSHIWERYYKGSKMHERPVVSTGLGLSIVKKIINLHGGSYGVKSELGKGTTFYFELPIKEANV